MVTTKTVYYSNFDRRLKKALIRNRILDMNQLDEYGKGLKDSKISLGELLIEKKILTEEKFINLVASDGNVSPLYLERLKEVPEAVLKLIPKKTASKNTVLPISRFGDTLTVAMSDPFDDPKKQNLEISIAQTGEKIKIQPIFSTEEDINKAILRIYPVQQVKEDEEDEEATSDTKRMKNEEKVQELTNEDFGFLIQEAQVKAESGKEEDEATDDIAGGIVSIVNRIIVDAYNQGASDIHIEPYQGKQQTVIRFRVDGECYIYKKIPDSIKKSLITRIKIMCDLDIAERRFPQDGKIKFKKYYPSLDIELRVATIPTVGGNEDAVMRILAASKPIPIEKMGFRDRNVDEFKKMVQYPYGLILVVGPTGSGKTTTLHSALGFINDSKRKIWTAEDPVEITQKGLRQVQVQAKIGFTFASAMKSFLRADPDVIMVGEMRDYETASMGVEASLTGHLVFSTLHTNSAPETVVRLIDMGLDPFNFADALLGIMAQRLARRLCTSCKTSRQMTEEEYYDLRKEFGGDETFDKVIGPLGEGMLMYEAEGCNVCNNTGAKGRLGIHELLVGTPRIKKMIQEKAHAEDLRDIAMEEGMTTLKQDGFIKAFSGVTGFHQVRAVCIK